MTRRRPTTDRRMIHIWLSEPTRRRLRLRAAEQDVTMQALVEDWIEKALAAQKAR